MKLTLEHLIGVGIAITGLYALFSIGVLVFQGPAPNLNIEMSDRSQTPAPTSVSPERPQPVLATAAQTDSDRGKRVFKKCAACHSADEDGANKIGPNLWKTFGRPIASVEGFIYSDALKSLSGETWSLERLDAFLQNPKKAIAGNRMTFTGLKKADDRAAVIAFLGGPDSGPTEETAAPKGTDTAAPPAPAEIVATPVVDPPQPSAAERKRVAALVADLEKIVENIDYQAAQYHPLHFSPAIETASNQQCLVCHQEILDNKPLTKSPAGVEADTVLAWYQTLDTYEGEQMTFHQRHLVSPYAKKVMNLTCNVCHQGSDPREEHPDMVATGKTDSGDTPPFTLRKSVNPTQTCLLCHGAFPDAEEIMGLPAPWPEARADFESTDTPNGCLTCHEELFRTERHRVTYLNAASIEEAAKSSSDVCYGCHGGRAWYKNSYPYPRTPWPDMDTESTPEWAAGRPVKSDPRYALPPAR